MIRKTLLTLTLLWMQAAALQAQVALTEWASARTDFELVAADSGAAVCYDAGDAAVVETAAVSNIIAQLFRSLFPPSAGR